MHHFLLLLSHVLGIQDEGTWYNFWSGIGSDLAEFALVGSVLRGFHLTRRQRNEHHNEHLAYLTKLTEKNDVN